jgi:hypothetical protein
MHSARKYYEIREELVSNTRLRKERGVGIAGNGMGLLNGLTTNRYSIAFVEGGGGCLQSKGVGYSTASPSVPGSCLKNLREPIKRSMNY